MHKRELALSTLLGFVASGWFWWGQSIDPAVEWIGLLWFWLNFSLLLPHPNDALGWKGFRQDWFIRRRNFSAATTKSKDDSSQGRDLSDLFRLPRRRINGLHDVCFRTVLGPRRLKKLAESRAVFRLMKHFGLFVELLRELRPGDGQPPELQGYNLGRGIEIHVRLRDEKTLRKISRDSVLRTLCHELAHNRHSHHDVDFRRFEAQLLCFLGMEPGVEDSSWSIHELKTDERRLGGVFPNPFEPNLWTNVWRQPINSTVIGV